MSKLKIVIIGVISLLLTGYVCIYHLHAPQIQSDIDVRATAAIKKYMLRGIEVLADGRDVVLAGEVLNSETKKRAEEVVGRVYGVRKVVNNIVVSKSEPIKIIVPESKL